MGILKKIKKMFSKNIDCSEELDGKILFLYSGKNCVVNVGANVIVPENFFAVFVCRDKVTDVLLPGKYAINGANLPKTFQRMRLGKANNKGKYKKKFNADIYYISRQEQYSVKFVSYDKFKTKNKFVGRVNANIEGSFDLVINDPDIMLKYFLSERPYIKEGLFLNILGGLVGNYVVSELQKMNEDLLNMIKYPDNTNLKLNDSVKLDTYFNDYGIRVSKVKIQQLNVRSDKKLDAIEKNCAKKSKKEQVEFDFNVPIMVGECDKNLNTSTENESNIRLKKCANCGNILRSQSLFCDKCGSKTNNLN